MSFFVFYHGIHHIFLANLSLEETEGPTRWWMARTFCPDIVVFFILLIVNCNKKTCHGKTSEVISLGASLGKFLQHIQGGESYMTKYHISGQQKVATSHDQFSPKGSFLLSENSLHQTPSQVGASTS